MSAVSFVEIMQTFPLLIYVTFVGETENINYWVPLTCRGQ